MFLSLYVQLAKVLWNLTVKDLKRIIYTSFFKKEKFLNENEPQKPSDL